MQAIGLHPTNGSPWSGGNIKIRLFQLQAQPLHQDSDKGGSHGQLEKLPGCLFCLSLLQRY